MTMFEDSLYKSSHYMLQSMPTDTGVDVTIVDLNHRTVVEEGFFDFNLKNRPQLKDFLEYLAPEFVANDFFDHTTDVTDDQEAWDSLDRIKNHVHGTVEISDIYNADNQYEFNGQPLFADYKIYDPETSQGPNPRLLASGSLLIKPKDKLYSKLSTLDIELAKDTVSEFILLNNIHSLLNKPDVFETGKIMQDVICNINHDDNNVYFIENLSKYSQEDYARFQEDVAQYGLENLVEGIQLNYSDVSPQNCINVYGAIKTVFDDKKMFFQEECREKKLSLDSLKKMTPVKKESIEVKPKTVEER